MLKHLKFQNINGEQNQQPFLLKSRRSKLCLFCHQDRETKVGVLLNKATATFSHQLSYASA